jgi:hypothetical protein
VGIQARANEREELLELISAFSPAEIRQLTNVARTMSRPIVEERNPQSTLVGDAFAEEFRARLVAHHATHTSGMDRLAFEAALRAASAAEGRTSTPAPSRTTRFWDVNIEGEQVSAKTSSARAMRRQVVEVSKLCEAAWIQDVRSARDRHDRTLQLFRDFSSAVQRWYALRIFETEDEFFYQLLEIPMWIFGEPVQALPVDRFAADGPSVPVTDDDGDALFTLKIDRSDGKVTLKGIPIERCVIHATWAVTKG